MFSGNDSRGEMGGDLMSGRRRSDGRLELALDRSWELEPNTWSSMTWWDPVPCGDSLFSNVLSEAQCPPPSPTTSLYTNPPTPFEFRDPPPTTPSNFSFRSSASSSDPPAAPRRISEESIFSPLSWPLPTTPSGTTWSPCTSLSSTSSNWPSTSTSTLSFSTTPTPQTWTCSSSSFSNWNPHAASSSSPLAWPLSKTPSPDYSAYSVFSSSMYSDDPPPLLQTPLPPYPLFPTPPDTNVPPPPLRAAMQDTSRAPPLLPTPPSTEDRLNKYELPNVRRGLKRSQKQVFNFPIPPPSVPPPSVPPPGGLGPFLAPPPSGLSGLPLIDIIRHPPPNIRPPTSLCLK